MPGIEEPVVVAMPDIIVEAGVLMLMLAMLIKDSTMGLRIDLFVRDGGGTFAAPDRGG